MISKEGEVVSIRADALESERGKLDLVIRKLEGAQRARGGKVESLMEMRRRLHSIGGESFELTLYIPRIYSGPRVYVGLARAK